MTGVSMSLPLYAFGYDFALDMIRALDPEAVRGHEVRIDATHLTTAGSSFARGCVEGFLVAGGATRLVIVGAPQHLADFVKDAVKENDLDEDRVVEESPGRRYALAS